MPEVERTGGDRYVGVTLSSNHLAQYSSEIGTNFTLMAEGDESCFASLLCQNNLAGTSILRKQTELLSNVNVYRSPPIASESPWPRPRSSTSG